MLYCYLVTTRGRMTDISANPNKEGQNEEINVKEFLKTKKQFMVKIQTTLTTLN